MPPGEGAFYSFSPENGPYGNNDAAAISAAGVHGSFRNGDPEAGMITEFAAGHKKGFLGGGKIFVHGEKGVRCFRGVLLQLKGGGRQGDFFCRGTRIHRGISQRLCENAVCQIQHHLASPKGMKFAGKIRRTTIIYLQKEAKSSMKCIFFVRCFTGLLFLFRLFKQRLKNIFSNQGFGVLIFTENMRINYNNQALLICSWTIGALYSGN